MTANRSVAPCHSSDTFQQRVSEPDLTIRLFGHFDVLVGGHSLLPFRTRTEARLLALLILRHGHWVRRDWIAAQLWPDSDRAGTWLMEALCRVRRNLGPHAPRIRNGRHSTLIFDPDGAEMDMLVFDRAVAENSAKGCTDAVSVYAGPLLEEFDDDWVIAERSLREERFLRCAERAAASYIDGGRAHDAVLLLLAAAQYDPLRESLHAPLMNAYAALGDHAAAMRTYYGLRRRLMGQNLPVASEIKELAARLRREAVKIGSTRPEHRTERALAHESPGPTMPCPLTEMIGRESELSSLSDEVLHNRLVTLTGMGGVGKTRLAIAIALRLAEVAGWHATMARLEGLPPAGDVARAVGSVMRIRSCGTTSIMDALAARLGLRATLLVLDNCEHVLTQAGSLCVALLDRCPRLRILATSRKPLGIPGEVVRRVPPLPHPCSHHLQSAGDRALQEASELPSVMLFAQRASAAEQTFRLGPDNVGLVAEICELLGGLPLGLELASARLHTMSLPALVEQIRRGDEPPPAMGAVPERHRSLNASVAWSADLLNQDERHVFERVAVFAGGFDASGAATVCGITVEEARRRLASLVEQSLVIPDMEGPYTRHRMHEVVRQHALSRLGDTDLKDARTHHLGHYRRLAEEAARHEQTPEERTWLDTLERERDNVRAACDFALTDPSLLRTGLALGAALQGYWELRGHAAEGREFFGRAVALARASGDASMIAAALRGSAIVAMAQGDGRAQALIKECLELLRAVGDEQGIADALVLAARIAEAQGDLTAARAYAEESLAFSRRAGYRRGEANAMAIMVRVLDAGRTYAQAVRAGREAVAAFRQIGDHVAEARTTAYLGRIEVRRGRMSDGLVLMDRGMAQLRQLGARRGLAVWLNIRGDLARAQNDLDGAARLYEEGLAAFRSERNLRGTAWALANLAEVSRAIGDLSESAYLAADALRIRFELQDYKGMAEALDCLVDAELASGKDSAAIRAARLGGAADAIRQMILTPLSPIQRRERRQRMRLIRRTIGRRGLAEHWKVGSEMSIAEAVSFALRERGEGGPSIWPG